MKQIKEATTTFIADQEEIPTKKMGVFYNPAMKLNRNFTLLMLKTEHELTKKQLKIGDPLAGSGIRSLRILNEIPETIQELHVNDLRPGFKELMQTNLEINKIKKQEQKKIFVCNEDANIFLSKNKFDYIDIDPFGTPNPFLDSAIRAIKRKGILAITATDTSALCGSYPKACRRKYWATPLRNETMHENAIRILTRKIQLIGAQYDKALIPIISYAKEHYVRIFLRVKQGKEAVDQILKQHEYVQIQQEKNKKKKEKTETKEKSESQIKEPKNETGQQEIIENQMFGPLWLGIIQDKDFIKGVLNTTNNTNINIDKETKKLLEQLYEESNINEPFFVDMHKISSQQKTNTTPKKELIIEILIKKGYLAEKTHFSGTGIKTNAPIKEIQKIIKELDKKQTC